MQIVHIKFWHIYITSRHEFTWASHFDQYIVHFDMKMLATEAVVNSCIFQLKHEVRFRGYTIYEENDVRFYRYVGWNIGGCNKTVNLLLSLSVAQLETAGILPVSC